MLQSTNGACRFTLPVVFYRRIFTRAAPDWDPIGTRPTPDWDPIGTPAWTENIDK